MRIGIVLMPTDDWPETVAQARRLEQLGYQHLWVYDHLTWQRYRDRPWHATYPWLAGLAASTGRIRLGTMVSNLNIRHPVVLAKDAMTLDHISSGRLTIGLGAAGTGFDATALGQAELSPGQRADRLAEAAEVLDGLLRGSLTDHRGAHYTLNEARMIPGCVQQPRVPLAIAATGRRTLGVAARYGDAWITYGDAGDGTATAAATERAVRRQLAQLEAHCEDLGRDPATIDKVFLTGHDAERPLADLDAFRQLVGRYAALGFTDVVFHLPRADDPVWNDPPTIVEEVAAAFLTPPGPA